MSFIGDLATFYKRYKWVPILKLLGYSAASLTFLILGCLKGNPHFIGLIFSLPLLIGQVALFVITTNKRR